MRFGLMSNYRRSWSKVGLRAILDNQMEYANRYLYSAIDPIKGDSFHIIGWGDVSTMHADKFIEKLKENYPNNHILLVWDNAPFHRPKILRRHMDVTILFLPPYSPMLNPVERFFGELRKVTANKTFNSIEEQQKLLNDEVALWIKGKERMKKLTGYGWIIEQWDRTL
jgi:transposase